MGGACCVAARDKNIVGCPSSDSVHRNIRCSPTWSLRWDNRGRVAGEETSITCFSGANSRDNDPSNKYELMYASEESGPLDAFRRHRRQKSSTISEDTTARARTPASDPSVSRNISTDTSLEQVKKSMESSIDFGQPTSRFSVSSPSTSSITSPALSQNYMHPASSNTPNWPYHSSECQLRGEGSDARILEGKLSHSFADPEDRFPTFSWSNESTRGSQGGSSNGWPMHAFSELMAPREKWSFDNDNLGFTHEKTKSSARISTSSGVDHRTCEICTKLLTEKSLWSSQKLMFTNELSVVAVLTCGHVYHAECLETLTPEVHKYDPSCPVCTLGEKQTHKLSQRLFKAEMNLKTKNKRSRNTNIDSDLDGEFIMYDRIKDDGSECKSPKMTSSSSVKYSLAKPFLKRHFSLGSKGSKTLTENCSGKRKGFFWTRSSKV